MNRKIDKVIHVQIPPTFKAHKNNRKCYCLKKTLYGLKQAGRLWHAALDEQLQAFGFRQCCTEPCIYTQGTKDIMVMLAVCVDNLLVIGATSSCMMSGVGRQKPRSVSKRYSVTVKLCDSYCGFRLTSVDTPFRGGSARSMSI